jgi:imidazoleglycerol phosphate synthase glutamine amidotransferase subunit HisH
VQFHPEKSSGAGLGLLGRWLDGVAARAALASPT